MGMYREMEGLPGIRLVGACEEDPATREAVRQAGIPVDYTEEETMLDEVRPDVVAVGDYYGIRGRRILTALRHGCHTVADKPLCTSLTELDAMEAAAKAQNRRIGCLLTLRELPWVEPLRALIRSGGLGEIHAVNFTGQHPLLWGSRPGWYFEPGKHGGTINDLAIHGIDLVTWLTGLSFRRVTAARCYHAFAGGAPDFRDCAQFMYELENGCGVTGDTSYAAPDGCGYGIPQYWRFTLWGDKGVAEADACDAAYTVALRNTAGTRRIECPAKPGQTLLAGFFAGLTGEAVSPDTDEVIGAARIALLLQQAADRA